MLVVIYFSYDNSDLLVYKHNITIFMQGALKGEATFVLFLFQHNIFPLYRESGTC